MNAVLLPPRASPRIVGFDADDEVGYQRWRADKLARRPRRAEDLIVDVADPRALSASERDALLQRCADCNMAVYRSRCVAPDKNIARSLARQLGLSRLDGNWLADEDGLSSIEVGDATDDRGGFIPYTDRAIHWHTDGYYQPPQRRIRAMLLHCVRPASSGGVNALLDHELAYIAVRDASPQWLQALMAPDAMTIPGREGPDGIARPAQGGPVFWFDPADGTLQMRYTARTRSIAWKADTPTREAVGFLVRFMADANPDAMRVRLDAGMGIVANNVLHDRSAFVDDPAQPRLLYRGRYHDRIGALESACRNG